MLSEQTGWTQPGSGGSISLPWLGMEPLNLEHPTAQVTLPGIFMELTIAQNKDVLSQPLLLLGRACDEVLANEIKWVSSVAASG